MDLNTIKKQRDLIIDVAEKYGAYNIRLFGSVARHHENQNSDIDLLVNFEPGRSLFELIELKDELEKLLSVQVYVISEKGLSQYIKDTVLQEAIEL
jgi:uncharacterized protein